MGTISDGLFINAWVVRQSAFSIQCGGLERLFIHFSKPEYYCVLLTDKDRDLPFGDISVQEGIFKRVGWLSNNNKTWIQPLSVGNWIGYDNPVSDFIWDKLKEHFKNESFDKWHFLEQSGECKVEDFLIEIELSISLNLK
jgi:hypothetical protein